MADNNPSNGAIGLVLGAAVAIAATLFLIGGGQLGVKDVNGDTDMPPIASGKQ